MNETHGDTETADPEENADVGEETSRIETHHLRYAAAGLGFVVAAIHLFHPDRGLPRLAQIAVVGWEHLWYDPRPLLFVLSGAAIIVAINVVLLGFPRKPVYVGGMILMATYVAGYFGWHFSGHGGFLPARTPNYHGLGPIESAVVHLTGSGWAFAAVASEIALFLVLALLYRRER